MYISAKILLDTLGLCKFGFEPVSGVVAWTVLYYRTGLTFL